MLIASIVESRYVLCKVVGLLNTEVEDVGTSRSTLRRIAGLPWASVIGPHENGDRFQRIPSRIDGPLCMRVEDIGTSRYALHSLAGLSWGLIVDIHGGRHCLRQIMSRIDGPLRMQAENIDAGKDDEGEE